MNGSTIDRRYAVIMASINGLIEDATNDAFRHAVDREEIELLRRVKNESVKLVDTQTRLSEHDIDPMTAIDRVERINESMKDIFEDTVANGNHASVLKTISIIQECVIMFLENIQRY